MAMCVVPAMTCGPSFPVAIFVRGSAPGVAYPKFAAGDLGVVQGTWPTRTLAVAYDVLQGRGLTMAEQGQAVSLETRQLNASGPDETPTGLSAWLRAREAIATPGGYTPGDPATKTPAGIEVDRQVPGSSYQSFTNCLDPAFGTATATLQDRGREHGAGSAEVMEWVRGQDAVFSGCAGPRPVYPWGPKPAPVPADLAPDRVPRPVGAGAPVWLKQDRAYQTAASAFYRTDYDGAIAGFRAVAADGASPWAKTARYLVARAMIRRATVGQKNDVPAPAKPGAEPTYEEGEKVETALKAKAPERLREARAVLEGIRADASMGWAQRAAVSLIDLVDAQSDPAKQAGVLAERLTATKAPEESTFGQNLVDLATVLRATRGAADGHVVPESGDGLLGWLAVMQAGKPTDGSGDERTTVRSPEVEARALATWRRTKALPWLVAAMQFAEPGGAGAGELVAAAKAVPEGSPGWLTVTYERLRLERGAGSGSGFRAEVEGVLRKMGSAEAPDRSAVNLFLRLLEPTSPNLEAFLEGAGRMPATTSIDGAEDAQMDRSPSEQACGPKLSEAELRLFDEHTATVLNQRMPVRLLAEAALSPALPPNLRFQVAGSAWTRAVLLGKVDVAKQVAPVLIGCREAWKPVLDAYTAAGNPDAVHVAGLLALMRFASTEPMVRAGEQRSEGFATYSQYRDNWWCGNAAYEGSDAKAAEDPKLRDRLFAQRLVPEGEVADPPFLTAADKAEAKSEVAALQKVSGAADYFAREALGWYRAHPADKVNVELLGQAERAMRNSCRSNASKELNRQMFVVVQGKYPGSEWARKYPTWE